MKKFFAALALAGAMVFTGTAAFAAETDLNDVLAGYDLTGEDILAIANVYKQVNEGNNPGLEGSDWYETEFKLAQLAADMGVGEAAKWMGEIYQGGHVEGVEENEAIEKAIEWWEKTVELGEPSGWTNIGLLYAHSNIPGGGGNHGAIELDYAKALEYYIKGYEGGDKKAPRYIAKAYAEGLGVEADEAKACEYYEIAAAQGDSTARYYAGQYYEEGKGVEQDYAKAAEYYEACAQGKKPTMPGVTVSRYKIGEFYEKGLGVEQNLETAISWYEAAAEFGSEEAQAALERLKK